MGGPMVEQVPASGVPVGGWLLDVREAHEWDAGHASAARHIPLSELGQRAAEIPQDETVYVICRSGARSERAAIALNGAGWQTVNVADGMMGWAQAGLPMVSASGSAPVVA